MLNYQPVFFHRTCCKHVQTRWLRSSNYQAQWPTEMSTTSLPKCQLIWKAAQMLSTSLLKRHTMLAMSGQYKNFILSALLFYELNSLNKKILHQKNDRYPCCKAKIFYHLEAPSSKASWERDRFAQVSYCRCVTFGASQSARLIWRSYRNGPPKKNIVDHHVHPFFPSKTYCHVWLSPIDQTIFFRTRGLSGWRPCSGNPWSF